MRTIADRQHEIVLANGDGTHARPLLRHPGFPGHPVVEKSPAWSSDGTELVFQRFVFQRYPLGQYDLFIVNRNGKRLRRIKDGGRDDSSPDWSPRGNLIAFMSQRRTGEGDDWANDDAEIYVVNVNGSGRRRLTRNNVADDAPAWSPDATHIAFVRGGSEPGIYSMRAAGTDLVRLTTDSSDYAPTWSPDGRQIAFERGTGRGWDVDILVMNADGSNVHTLVGGKWPDYDPAWSPDGTKLPSRATWEHLHSGISMRASSSLLRQAVLRNVLHGTRQRRSSPHGSRAASVASGSR